MKKLHFSGNKIPIFRPEPENQKSSFSGRSRSRKDFRHISNTKYLISATFCYINLNPEVPRLNGQSATDGTSVIVWTALA